MTGCTQTADTLLDPPAQRTEGHLTDIFRALSLPLPLREKVGAPQCTP